MSETPTPLADSEFEQFRKEIEQNRDVELRRHPERVDEIRERFAAKLDLVAEWREIEREQIA